MIYTSLEIFTLKNYHLKHADFEDIEAMFTLIYYNYLIEAFCDFTEYAESVFHKSTIDLWKHQRETCKNSDRKIKEMRTDSQSTLIKIHFLHCTFCFIKKDVKVSALNKS